MVVTSKSTLDFLNKLNHLVAICDGDIILSLNARGIELLGLSSEQEAEGRCFFEFFHPDFQMISDLGLGVFADDETVIAIKLIRADGKELEADLWVSRIGAGTESQFLIEAHDMTRHLKTARVLRAREQRLEGIINSVADGILSLDDDGTILEVNPAGQRIFRFTKEQAIGRHIQDFLNLGGDVSSQEPTSSVRTPLTWAQKLTSSSELRARRQDGASFVVEIAARELQVEGRMSYTCVFRDISARVMERDRMYRMAHHDPLTGLPNRQLLLDRLEEAAKRTQRHRTKFAVLYIDLNKFKPINDQFGHDVGDHVLREVAHRMSNTIRGTDTAARVGGDEFVILLEGVQARSEVEFVVQKVLAKLTMPVPFQDRLHDIGASMGVALYPNDTTDLAKLLTAADMAMYACKKERSDRHYLFVEDHGSMDRISAASGS